MNYILDPWPWYVTGPLIALIMYALVYFGRAFGMSANLNTFCTMAGAGKKVDYFNTNWQSQKWNLMVVAGSIIGGFIGHILLSNPTNIDLNPVTIGHLEELGFSNAGASLLPGELYNWEAVFTLKGFLILVIGGFLVGFGTRFAGGCTSGHAISGLSSLQLPSLVAVIGFFIGGLVMVHLLFPLIF